MKHRSWFSLHHTKGMYPKLQDLVSPYFASNLVISGKGSRFQAWHCHWVTVNDRRPIQIIEIVNLSDGQSVTLRDHEHKAMQWCQILNLYHKLGTLNLHTNRCCTWGLSWFIQGTLGVLISKVSKVSKILSPILSLCFVKRSGSKVGLQDVKQSRARICHIDVSNIHFNMPLINYAKNESSLIISKGHQYSDSESSAKLWLWVISNKNS